ncbi:adenylate kinase [Chloropicon primus]|uniref:adenylate kinase n=1 Tax=Chloropicon primus TaxID=1764295 RepID=A0A5B8MBN9_9CHLO|nr:adenylate kinase [Chloropicon primus]|eukprot:QDZ17886.1 adenylate kinase [Chloropicon primus]
MKVSLAPIESHVLKVAGEDFKAREYEVVEIRQEELEGASETSVQNVVENTDYLVVDIALAPSFVRALVRLERSKPELFAGKVVVGLTSVVSWGQTLGEKVSDADETRRTPIPGALKLLELERLLMSCECSQVLCHGILYGSGECHAGLKHLFDQAFREGTVTLYGEGGANIPLVNVKDVVQFLDLIVASKLTKKYCLVVDEVENTLKEVTETIAASFGAKVETASLEDAIFLEEKKVDHLFLNLKPECTKVDDYVFQFSGGLASEMKAISAEYTASLGYSPHAFFLSGPPGSGKTYFAKTLCEKFGLEYVSKEVVEAMAKEKEGTEEEEGESNDENKLLTSFREIMDKPNIENKGYVLDGYPATIQEALELFPNADFQEKEKEKEEETQSSEGEEEPSPEAEAEETKKHLYPNVSIYVKADDPVLQERSAASGAADFTGRYTAFKKSSDEDKKQFQDLLKKLDENAKEQDGVEKSGEEVSTRAVVDEIAQSNGLGAYFAFMGSKFFDFDNNRKEVAPVDPTEEGEKSEEAEGEKAEAEEPEPEFSPIESLLAKIEGKTDESSEEAQGDPEEEAPKEAEEPGEATEKEEAAAQPEQKEALKEAETVDTDVSQLEELEVLIKPVKAYLASELAPAISEGFIKLVEAKPEDPVQFLGEFLVKQSESMTAELSSS